MKTDKRGFLKGLMAAIWTPVAFKHAKAVEPEPPVIKLKDYYDAPISFCCSGIVTGEYKSMFRYGTSGHYIVSG